MIAAVRAPLGWRRRAAAAPAAPARPWRAWPAVEAAIVLAAFAAATVAVIAVVRAANVDARDEVAPGIGPLWSAAMVLLAVGAVLVQRRAARPALSRTAVAVLAGVAGAVAMTPLMAGLHGTNQPLNTILGGDMAFRTEDVTRFASTWHLDDFTFRGLHAFYPPAWFWAAGRLAHALGIVPWHIVKPFTIGTVAAALLVAYALWRMVLSPAGALAAAIGASLVLSTQVGPVRFSTLAWYEPYSCFVAVTGAAWVAAGLLAVRRGGWARLALLAVVGAVLALSYYLLFLILAVVLLALASAPAPARRAALGRALALLGAIAALTAVFWIPLAGAVLGGSASQGHFVSPHLLVVAIGLGGPAGLSVLAVVAAVLLLATWRAIPSQAVAGVIAGTIAYQLVSLATLVLSHNQLQPHRAATMLWATFGAAVPVALECLSRSGAPVLVLAAAPLRRAAVAVAAVLAIPAVFLLGAAQGTDLASGPFTRAAHLAPDLRQAAEISGYITRTARRPPQRLTIVTGGRQLLVTEPYFGFLPLRARYAHPKADVPQRVAVLRAAAACPTPACARRTLTRSRFGPIDALVLARTPEGYRVDTQVDAFPDPRPVTILFRRGLLSPRDWDLRPFGAYTVFVRRPAGVDRGPGRSS